MKRPNDKIKEREKKRIESLTTYRKGIKATRDGFINCVI
jgi:hypothetical protein